MHVIRDDELISKRAKWGQYGMLAAALILVASLFLTSRQPQIAWGLLLVGYVAAVALMRLTSRFVRLPRPDTVLDKLLKGLDNRYTLYHYRQPAEHLLLTPSGLVAIEVRDVQGRVAVRKGRWSHAPLSQKIRLLIGDAGLGDPFADARRSIARTQRAVPELQGESAATFDGLILFTSPKVQITAEEPEMPVVRPEDLRNTVREIVESHPALTTSQRKNLAVALRGAGAVEETEAAEA